jgi:hypothetical protein
MDGGRFVTVLVVAVFLTGWLGYYENTQTVALNNRIDLVQSKAENAETSATEAKAAANEAKAAVAGLTANNQKAGDIALLTKQATDAAATATQAAEQAKQAVEEAAAAGKGRARRR